MTAKYLRLIASKPFRSDLPRAVLGSNFFSRSLSSVTTRTSSSFQKSCLNQDKKNFLSKTNQVSYIHTGEKRTFKEKILSLSLLEANAKILAPLFCIFGISYFIYVTFKDDLDAKELKRFEKKLGDRRERILSSLSDVVSISPKEANNILTKSETTTLLNGKGGDASTIRIDANQVASNKDIEDRLYMDSEIKDDVLLLGVFDGHSGYNCSEFISKNLPPLVRKEIESLLYSLSVETRIPEMTEIIGKIKEKIQESFCQIDDLIVHEVRKTKKNLTKEDLEPAVNGSCALLAAVDVTNNNLFVACTGDSRAVMGSLRENGSWVAIPLSKDQTANNPRELSRILKEHPGEEDTAIQRKRILGSLEPTRAFGDARYKWDLDVQLELYPKFFPERKPPPKNLLTPPYVTARPEVCFHRINPRNDQFIVLATDGLYDEMTNQQIVELVGDQLARPTPDSVSNLKLRSKNNTSEVFSFQDSNLATHLIRNALGGGKFEVSNGEVVSPLLLKRLSVPAPQSRKYRDDITVIVLQFGTFDNN